MSCQTLVATCNASFPSKGCSCANQNCRSRDKCGGACRDKALPQSQGKAFALAWCNGQHLLNASFQEDRWAYWNRDEVSSLRACIAGCCGRETQCSIFPQDFLIHLAGRLPKLIQLAHCGSSDRLICINSFRLSIVWPKKEIWCALWLPTMISIQAACVYTEGPWT